jgi:hypothetical protein
MNAAQRAVENTRAIRWWIDRQIELGRDDDWIAAVLPFAVEFITGRLTESELLALTHAS